MKPLLLLVILIVFSISAVSAQTEFTLHIYYAQYQPVDQELYGVHLSGFFDRCRCYDPDSTGGGVDSIDQCMAYAAALQPRVLRFPTGGENKFVSLLDGPPGYGYEQFLIDSALARGYLDTADWYNWSETVTNQYVINPDSAHYIDRLIDFIQYCDSVNDFAPSVIFVANVSKQAMFPDMFTNVTTENLAAIRYLLDNDINITAIEMGSEHYDDGNDIDTFATFNGYWKLIKPLLDSLQADPALNPIPVSLVAAPEPEFAAYIGIGAASVDHYKDWNERLRSKADTAATSAKFNAFSVHLYNTDNTMEPCYELYKDLYYDSTFNYAISFIDPDINLTPSFECARDSFYSFANNYLPLIFDRYSADDSNYCLGTAKSYILSEWGVKPPKNPGSMGPVTDSTLLGNFNNTFAEAGFTFMYLLSLTDIDTLDGGANIEMATKHTEMAGFTYGLVSYWSDLDVDDPDQRFVKRASWYAYKLMQNIFNRNYERVKSDVILLAGSTTPYIKTYFGGDGAYTGTGWAPYFHMFFYNPTSDTLFCIRDSITADTTFGYGIEDPLNGHMKYRYIVAEQLYSHGGDNQYMRDNDFYTGDIAPLLDTIYEDTVPLGVNPIILPYSMGEFYWRLVPLPYKEEDGLIAGDVRITAYPNPASEYVEFTVDLSAVYKNEYTINIYNLFGQKIRELWVLDNHATWYTDDAAKGIYIYEIASCGKRLGAGKIIIQ